MNEPAVSIVIPTYNRHADLRRLLQSIELSRYPQDKIETIIVNNATDPDLTSIVEDVKIPTSIIEPGENLFSNGARKIGAKAAKGDFIFLLDDDNELEPDCIKHLVDSLENDISLGAVGPIMLNGSTNDIWCAGAYLSKIGLPKYLLGGESLLTINMPSSIDDIQYFPNACMVRKDVLEIVPLDFKMFPHNWAETDFCLRILKAGYKLKTIPSAIERHHIGYTGSLTRIGPEKTYDQAKSRILFRRRHLSGLTNWLNFWGIIFPASTMIYFLRILESTNKQRYQTLRAYIRGTFDGVSTKMLPPETDLI
jgi:GT2 family glycosyltransferase